MAELSKEERELFRYVQKTGDWDAFTEHYFRLPWSGTWYTPEDHVVQYEAMYDVWRNLGEPEERFEVVIEDKPVEMRVSWDPYYGGYPMFLLPHGFRTMPWMREFLDLHITKGIAVTGTGSGKAQPLDAKVLTPWGWEYMGNLSTGGVVVGRDGQVKRVLGVYPQGVRPTYTVMLEGCISTEADEEHLWQLHDHSIVTTADLCPDHYIPVMGNTPKRVISVRHTGEDEVQCIDVEDDLYVTDDYIVTHNTAGVAIRALTYCALFPGFRFLNVAPGQVQADLALGEVSKWAGNTEFRKFIVESRGANPLWKEKPYPMVSVEVVEGYPSTFICQTVKQDATAVLGGERDWINADEAQLLQGIEEAQEIFATRLRGTRGTGVPRSTKLTWITNPGHNPELMSLMDQYRDLEEKGDKGVLVLEGVDTSDNIYLTKRQKEEQRKVLNQRAKDRWHGGQMSAVLQNAEIGEDLLENCYDKRLDEWTQKHGKYIDGWGLMEYSRPYQQGHTYVVAGDTGKSSIVSMNSQNIPCIMVFDVTQFLDDPMELAAFYWFDGQGTYDTFVKKFLNTMWKYQAAGYYDATNVQTAFEDLDERFSYAPTTPIFFSGTSGPKRWAVAIAVQLMSERQFRWPRIKSFWHQARIFEYASRKKADDIIATLLVFALALRTEGTLWSRFVEVYNWDEEEFDNEELDLPSTDETEGAYVEDMGRYGRLL